MQPQAPPIPPFGPPSSSQKSVPKWVWWIAGFSLLFLIGMYVLLFFGWNWAVGRQREEFTQMNPDFEFQYINNAGKVRAKHKPTGREFVLEPSPAWRVTQIRAIATQAVSGPLPDWTRLPKAQAEDEHTLVLEGADAADVIDELEVAGKSHGYRREQPSGVALARDLVMCNPKTLDCLACSAKASDHVTRYEIWRTRVP